MELSSTRGSSLSLSLSARKLCGLFWSLQIYGNKEPLFASGRSKIPLLKVFF